MARLMAVCRRPTLTTLIAVSSVMAGCALGTPDQTAGAFGRGVEAEAARPAPIDECRELGGGWQWRGSRATGTSSVGHKESLDANEIRGDEMVVSGPALDDDALRDSVEQRDAAGWTEDRLLQLDLVGRDYESAPRFEGTREEFELLRSEIEDMLDAAPHCDGDW